MSEKDLQTQYEEFNLNQAKENHEAEKREREAFLPLNLRVTEQEMYRRNLECLTSIWRTEKNDHDLAKTVVDKMMALVKKLES